MLSDEDEVIDEEVPVVELEMLGVNSEDVETHVVGTRVDEDSFSKHFVHVIVTISIDVVVV